MSDLKLLTSRFVNSQELNYKTTVYFVLYP